MDFREHLVLDGREIVLFELLAVELPKTAGQRRHMEGVGLVVVPTPRPPCQGAGCIHHVALSHLPSTRTFENLLRKGLYLRRREKDQVLSLVSNGLEAHDEKCVHAF